MEYPMPNAITQEIREAAEFLVSVAASFMTFVSLPYGVYQIGEV